MIEREHITGIILAGGKSSRMGTDKGFLKFKNESFIESSIKALQPLVGEILIVSDNNKYDIFGITRVNDIIENAGPLAGVYSGLYHSKTAFNLVLSCDIPLITTSVLKKITTQISGSYDIIQLESMGKPMPLIAFYNKRCEKIILEILEQGNRRMTSAHSFFKVKTIPLELKFESTTTNINTPSQLHKLINETYS